MWFFKIGADLFIYLFLAVLGLHCCVSFLAQKKQHLPFRCGAQVSQCSSFSCCGAQALGVWASVAVAPELSSCRFLALEYRINSCGTQA